MEERSSGMAVTDSGVSDMSNKQTAYSKEIGLGLSLIHI